MPRPKFVSRGCWSRFDFPKTVEVSCLLHQLDNKARDDSFRRYRSLQHWTEMYPSSGVAPIELRANHFKHLIGLNLSFFLRRDGFFKPFTHYVFAFKVLSSGFFVIYGKDGIVLHCFPNESPELVAQVVLRLYVRLIIPLVRKSIRRKNRGRYPRRRSTG